MNHHCKSFGSRFAGLLLAAAALPASASADITDGPLSVTATVTSNCTVSTLPVAFGPINLLSGSNIDATGSVTVTCTNGSPWAASADAGTGAAATLTTRKMMSGGNSLDYILYTDAARTSIWGDGTGTTVTVSNTGTGNAQSFTVYGRVPAGQSTVPVGSYSDSVLVTITY